MPSLVEIPFVWLEPMVAAVENSALAGTVQSALFMAGAVVMLRVIATDRGMAAAGGGSPSRVSPLHPGDHRPPPNPA